jgi:hypothetical protein
MNPNSNKSLFRNNSIKANVVKNTNVVKNSNMKNSTSLTSTNPSTFSNIFKNFSLKKLLIAILILIILGLIIYIIYTLIHYYNTECYEKKELKNYLFSSSNDEVCIQEKAPVPATPVPLPEERKRILPILEKKNEVFHIANQDYTYDQAKCKCESYGSRLATKAEVTDAYNNGAHWCSYGWTEKQSAYYPVQKCEWDKMMEENQRLPPKDRKYCGIPGVNGGFFSNPELKFGVNCYGVKPKGKISKEKKAYCPPMNFCKLDNNYEASHKLETDEIVGFNDEKWSENM